MNDVAKPDIGILLADVFPEELELKFKNELQHPSLNIMTKRVTLGPFNSLDWAIPTAIAVYLMKSYFDSFLKEAGKDHYHKLRDWLKKSSENSRSIKTRVIAATQSQEKLEQNNTQSKTFSVHAVDTGIENKIKFLFDESLSQDTWNQAIDNLLNLLEQYYTNAPAHEISITIKKNDLQREVYAKIRSKDGTWEFTDMRKLINEQTK